MQTHSTVHTVDYPERFAFIWSEPVERQKGELIPLWKNFDRYYNGVCSKDQEVCTKNCAQPCIGGPITNLFIIYSSSWLKILQCAPKVTHFGV